MEEERGRAGRWMLLVLALGLHLAVGFFILVSGLVAPMWAVLLLLALWGGLFVLGYRNHNRPFLVLLMPVVAAIAWFVVVQGGALFLGWTA